MGRRITRTAIKSIRRPLESVGWLGTSGYQVIVNQVERRRARRRRMRGATDWVLLAMAVGMVAMLALAAIGLFGCAAERIVYRSITVPVAVPVEPPKVEVPPRPRLAIEDLVGDNAADDAEMIAAWVASLDSCRRDDRLLRGLLRPFAK